MTHDKYITNGKIQMNEQGTQPLHLAYMSHYA